MPPADPGDRRGLPGHFLTIPALPAPLPPCASFTTAPSRSSHHASGPRKSPRRVLVFAAAGRPARRVFREATATGCCRGCTQNLRAPQSRPATRPVSGLRLYRDTQSAVLFRMPAPAAPVRSPRLRRGASACAGRRRQTIEGGATLRHILGPLRRPIARSKADRFSSASNHGGCAPLAPPFVFARHRMAPAQIDATARQFATTVRRRPYLRLSTTRGITARATAAIRSPAANS